MPRNVARTLHWPCASSHRHSPTTPLSLLRHYTSTTQPQQFDQEKATHILRIADQNALRETRIAASKYISNIHKLQAATAAVPTTIKDPNIPVPYTLGLLREKVRITAPQRAEETIAAVEKVLAHLHDLATEGYKDKTDGEKAMEAFEREIQSWSQEKKEDTLKTWRLEEEARLNRLNESSQRLVNCVNDVLRRGVAAKIKPPSFGSAEASSAKVSKTDGERKVVGMEGEEKQMPANKAQSMGLAYLQKQLEASITGSGGGKN